MRLIRSLLPLVVCLWLHSALDAQETTGSLGGWVLDSDGAGVPFAKVALEQKSTGTQWETMTQADGHFAFPQIPPSLDYEIRVAVISHAPVAVSRIEVKLGEQSSIELKLEARELDAVEINAHSLESISDPRRGNETTIQAKTLAQITSMDRSLQEATRILPEANLNAFGGASYRFNNISIDGSATNDVIGFQEPASGAAGSVASGTPGGLSGTQPIGYGAIGSISVKTAPFDVSLGNFTGASLNLVTRQGGNEFEGQVYGFGRNQFLMGKYAGGLRQANAGFQEGQAGFSLGGPVVKGKLFFFGNAEFSHRAEPVLNAPGSKDSNIPVEVVQEIADTLQARFGYDPGAYADAQNMRQNLKLMLRFDANIGKNHKLTLRDNLVVGYADYLEWSSNFFNFGNQGYRHHSNANSLAAELRSTIGTKLLNKLQVSYNSVRDKRSFEGEVFPHIEINYNTVNTIFAGTYREAAIYGADSDTYQILDKLTLPLGKHTLTGGFSAEWNAIEYRFLTAWNGRWQYRSLQDFFDDRPSRVRGVCNAENNDFAYNKMLPSADYDVMLGAVFVQDEWRANDRLSLALGVRADVQYLPVDFPLNPQLAATPEFQGYRNEIGFVPQINPRFSAHYLLNAQKTIKLRAGSGLFTGRMPFVWYAYSHYISGTRYYNIDLSPSGPMPLTLNLADLAATQPNLTEINLVDNGFRLPRDWKSNLGLDLKLPAGFNLALDGSYSQVLQGLLFQSINRKDSLGNFEGADSRPYYLATGSAIKINPGFTNVFLLTNVHAGYRYNLTASLSKQTQRYQGYLGYTYGQSKDISSTVRNSHAANFEWNQAVVANDPALAYSNFDLRHKLVSYHLLDIPIRKSTLSLGLVWTSRSGSPYSYVYEGDMNRDGSAKNDLIFIPARRSDIVLADIQDGSGAVLVSADAQWAQLDAFIAGDAYLSRHRGQYAERNGARTPWNHQLDLRAIHEFRLFEGKQRLALSFDLKNVANLLHREWGAQYFVPNVQNSGYGLLDFVRIAQNRPVFQFKSPAGHPWLTDPVNSRWQGQFGVQYSF